MTEHMDKPWIVVIDEGMYDAGAWIIHDPDQDWQPTGHQRTWSAHHTEAGAQAELAKAGEQAAGRLLP